jgi:hypothetical protein
MTKRKRDNSLFLHLKSVFNKMLPLEYAIRASTEINPTIFNPLLEIDRKIRQYWIALGFNEKEIDIECLMDFAWDTIQIGFPLSRRHGRIYQDRKFISLINQGLANIHENFGIQISELGIPAARYFRACDLINGNDLLPMLNTVIECLNETRAYEATDDIEFTKFVRSIREPIHIHPGIQFVAGEFPNSREPISGFGLLIDTESDLSTKEIKQQIREFLYQFALRKRSSFPSGAPDDTSESLINEFLNEEIFGLTDTQQVVRLDAFISILTGLYCWDLVQMYKLEKRKSAINDAITEVLKIYPNGNGVHRVSFDTIRKNYYSIKKEIKKMGITISK